MVAPLTQNVLTYLSMHEKRHKEKRRTRRGYMGIALSTIQKEFPNRRNRVATIVSDLVLAGDVTYTAQSRYKISV